MTEQSGQPQKGFCIYIDTICDGPIPIEHYEDGTVVIHATRESAEREIAEDTMERLQQYLDGARDFEDAMFVEEYIVEVDVWPDGSVTDERGLCFKGAPA
jgi:hypothetical protein